MSTTRVVVCWHHAHGRAAPEPEHFDPPRQSTPALDLLLSGRTAMLLSAPLLSRALHRGASALLINGRYSGTLHTTAAGTKRAWNRPSG